MILRIPAQHDNLAHPEDLSTRERRGQLSAAEKRRLQLALAASESLRCAHQLGHDFDALDTVADGDVELIERAITRASARCRPSRALPTRSRWRRALPWVAVVSLLLASATAGATLWPFAEAMLTSRTRSAVTNSGTLPAVATRERSVQRLLSDSSDVKATSLEIETSRRAEPSRAVLDQGATNQPNQSDYVEPIVPKAREQVASSERNEALSTERVPAPVASQSADETQRHKTAPELFSEANAARRQGDAERARALYRALGNTFPTASETALSCVMLGRIELQRHAVNDALHQFQRYLWLAPRGPLAEEALEGKARAYRELAMPSEEAMTWRELLSRFPGSVYAKTARQRLNELR